VSEPRNKFETFIKRLDKLTLNSPGENWDGTWRLEQK